MTETEKETENRIIGGTKIGHKFGKRNWEEDIEKFGQCETLSEHIRIHIRHCFHLLSET